MAEAGADVVCADIDLAGAQVERLPGAGLQRPRERC